MRVYHRLFDHSFNKKRRITLFVAILLLTFLGQLTFGQDLIQNSVKKRIDALLSRQESAKGPNCWNAALYAMGAYPYVIHTSDIHTKRIFDASCRIQNTQIQNAEQGSVIRYKCDDEELHAFIKLNNEEFFEKESTAGGYKIVPLSKIDADYGKAYCEVRNRKWSYQVLKCNPTRYLIPKEYNELFIMLSEAIKSPKSFLDKKENVLLLMERILKNHNMVNQLKDYPDLVLFLIDMEATTGTKFKFDPKDIDQNIQIAFSESTNHFVAVHFYKLLNSTTTISDDILNEIFAFGTDAKALTNNPDLFANVLIEKMQLQGLLKDNAVIDAKLWLYSNENIEYREASVLVSTALKDLNSNASLYNSLKDFFRYAKTDYVDKEQDKETYLNSILALERIDDDKALLFKEVLFDPQFPEARKTYFLNRFLQRAK